MTIRRGGLSWASMNRSHQQGVGRGPIEVDLVIFRAVPLGQVLQTVQGALAGQGRHRRILAQFVVVVEILVSQRQAEDALAQKRLQPVLDQARIAPVGEASREPADQPKAMIHLPQQQRARNST